MDKIERINALIEKENELYDQKQKIEEKLKETSKVYHKNRCLQESKKAGNVLLIIAVIAIILEIILVATGSAFETVDLVIIGVFLVPGVIKKMKGMKEYKQLSDELRHVDVQAVLDEHFELSSESYDLSKTISELRNERDKLYRYTGKEWRLNEMTSFDTKSLQRLEQDLKDVVFSINNSTDEMFISNNWLINNIMLHMTFGLQKDTVNAQKLDKALNKIYDESSSWPLRLLFVLILAGSIRLLNRIADDDMVEEWETACQRAKLPDPVDQKDAEFYIDATVAADKCIDLVAKVIKEQHAANASRY